jgi:hypothetical protein
MAMSQEDSDFMETQLAFESALSKFIDVLSDNEMDIKERILDILFEYNIEVHE